MSHPDPKKGRDPNNPGPCGAKTRSGKPCAKRPMLGGIRCRLHGGSSPQALRVAAETLAEWRLRRVKQLNNGLDVLLNEPDGRRLAALMVKQPGLIARLLEVTDRLQGGGEKLEIGGTDGGPLQVSIVDVARLADPRPKEPSKA